MGLEGVRFPVSGSTGLNDSQSVSQSVLHYTGKLQMKAMVPAMFPLYQSSDRVLCTRACVICGRAEADR